VEVDPMRAGQVLRAPERRHRGHRGVAEKSLLREDGERRLARMANGPFGGAVAASRPAGGLLDAFACPRKVVTELARGHLVHPAVKIPMDGDLVALPCRLPHEVR